MQMHAANECCVYFATDAASVVVRVTARKSGGVAKDGGDEDNDATPPKTRTEARLCAAEVFRRRGGFAVNLCAIAENEHVRIVELNADVDRESSISTIDNDDDGTTAMTVRVSRIAADNWESTARDATASDMALRTAVDDPTMRFDAEMKRQRTSANEVCSVPAPGLDLNAVLDGPSLLFMRTADAALVVARCDDAQRQYVRDVYASPSQPQFISSSWGTKHSCSLLGNGYWRQRSGAHATRACLVLLTHDALRHRRRRNQGSDGVDAESSVLLEIVIEEVDAFDGSHHGHTHVDDAAAAAEEDGGMTTRECDAVVAADHAARYVPRDCAMHAVCGCFRSDGPDSGVVLGVRDAQNDGGWKACTFVDGAEDTCLTGALDPSSTPISMHMFDDGYAEALVVVYDNGSAELRDYTRGCGLQILCRIRGVSMAIALDTHVVWLPTSSDAGCPELDTTVPSAVSRLEHDCDKRSMALYTRFIDDDVSFNPDPDGVRGGDDSVADDESSRARHSLLAVYNMLFRLFQQKCADVTAQVSVIEGKRQMIADAKRLLRELGGSDMENAMFARAISYRVLKNDVLVVVVRVSIQPEAAANVRKVAGIVVREDGTSHGACEMVWDGDDSIAHTGSTSTSLFIRCDASALADASALFLLISGERRHDSRADWAYFLHACGSFHLDVLPREDAVSQAQPWEQQEGGKLIESLFVSSSSRDRDVNASGAMDLPALLREVCTKDGDKDDEEAGPSTSARAGMESAEIRIAARDKIQLRTAVMRLCHRAEHMTVERSLFSPERIQLLSEASLALHDLHANALTLIETLLASDTHADNDTSSSRLEQLRRRFIEAQIDADLGVSALRPAVFALPDCNETKDDVL